MSALLMAVVAVAYAGVDCTSKVDKSNWTNQGNAITVNGVELREHYVTNATDIGDVMYQTVSGLDNGTYIVSFYANACYTSGRGWSSDVVGGETDRVYVYAGDKKAYVEAARTSGVAFSGVYAVSNVKVTDGSLRMGIYKEKTGTNWLSLQIKSLTKVDNDVVFDKQKYYFRNVESGLYLGAGNGYGVQGSLVKHPEFFTLHPVDNEQYQFFSRFLNSSNGGHYLGDNGYLDNPSPANLTIAKVTGTDYYTISLNGTYYGYDGTSTIMALNLSASDTKVRWEIISGDEMILQMKQATSASPKDATFLIKDPNFSPNHVNKPAWFMESYDYTHSWSSTWNSAGGSLDNTCAESYMASFSLVQTLTGLPEGIYSLTAQGFYRGSGNVPYIYAGDKKSELNLLTTDEDDMAKASTTFTNGNYKIAPITNIRVGADGVLKIGVKLIDNKNLWTIWDNFELTYYGITELLKEDIRSYIAEATPYVSTEERMATTIRTAISTAIDNGNAQLENQSATNAQLETAREDLKNAIDNAKASIKAYDYLEREMVAARSIVIGDLATYEAILTSCTALEDAVVAAAQAVNVAVYNKVKTDYTKEWALGDTWTGSINKGNPGIGQHWSGDKTIGYYDANGSNMNHSVATSVSLPAGDYVLMAAGRSHEKATMKLEVGDSTVVFNAKGDRGYGIETNGQANFSASGTYTDVDADGDKIGRGWEWAYVQFHLDDDTDLQLKAILTSGADWAWGSFSDLTLYMTDETFNSFAYKFLDEALEQYKPFTESGDYVDLYKGIKAKREATDYADSDAINAAVAELEAAYPAYVLENASLEHPADVTEGVIRLADCAANDISADEGVWEGSGRTMGSGQHWSGDASRQYFTQNHENGAARTQKINIPYTGLYILKSSVRVVGGYVDITVGTRNAHITQVTGRTGGTIATDGTEWESVEAGRTAGKAFANSNNGYGWIYNNIYFYAAKDDSVAIAIALSNVNNNGREANVGSVQLLYCGENSNYTETTGDLTSLVGKYTAAEIPAITTANVNTTSAVLPGNTTITHATSNPNMLIYANASQVANGQNVIVEGACDKLVITDGHPFIATTGFNATAASYEMAAVASNTEVSYGTLCLPFAVSTLPADGSAYELMGEVTMGNKLAATPVATVAANTPVIVTKKGTYSGSGAVAAVAGGATFTRGQLVGGYTQTTAPERSYVLQKHGEDVAFYIVNNVKPTVNPFRAYIKAQAMSEAKYFSLVFDEEGTTGIVGVDGDALVEIERYNATGVRIAAPEKGLNIIRYSNGATKKVMVK